MDRRKIKLKGSLHKNLIGSQTSSQSNSDAISLTAKPARNKSLLLAEKTLSTESKLTANKRSKIKINY